MDCNGERQKCVRIVKKQRSGASFKGEELNQGTSGGHRKNTLMQPIAWKESVELAD